MEITYTTKEANVAELMIDENLIKYRIPPATGTHSEVFQALSADKKLRVAEGREIVAYANGCLVCKKNEWQDQNRVRFPSQNYLRFPVVLTIVPRKKEFGELEGGMLVDSDLSGEGIEKKTKVPKDLSGWKVSQGEVLIRDKRLFVPYDSWYKNQWDEKNGAVIALCSLEGAEALARTAKNSGRNYRPLWKVNPAEIDSPEKRVPVLCGDGAGRLSLGCYSHGDGRYGCGVGVL